MLIGEQTARTLWPGADPIGQHVKIGGDTGPWRTIVGIVGDVRHQDLAATPTLQMYLPQSQNTDSFLTLVIRTQGDPSQLADDARRAIAAEARDVPVSRDRAADGSGGAVDRTAALRHGAARAVRRARAADDGDRRLRGDLVLGGRADARDRHPRGARRAACATSCGWWSAAGWRSSAPVSAPASRSRFAASRFLESSLYSVSTTDPATFAAVAGVLLVVALVAQGVPIVRAMRVDPTIALRQD